MTPTLRYVATTLFKKDYKRAQKQGKDMTILHGVIRLILNRQPLPARYRDHKLVGNYSGWRECHLAPDWLLIYRTTDTEAIFGRTGSHSELFK